MVFSGTVYAESKEIVSEGMYIMGDGETPTVAQERAILDAKRKALEEAGAYLESFTEVKNMQLTKDEIKVFASGIVEAEILEQKREIVGGEAFKFWVKVKCVVTTDNVQKMKNKLRESLDSNAILENLKKIQDAYDRSQQEISELKRQLAQVESSQDKKAIQAQIVNNERSFSFTQWMEKAENLILKGDYEGAIEDYNHAIQLENSNSKGYLGRGTVYFYKEWDAQNRQEALLYTEKALADYEMALKLNPQLIEVYWKKILVNLRAGNDIIKDAKAGIKQFNLQISKIDDKKLKATAYICLAKFYNTENMWDSSRVTAALDKAIEIDPLCAEAYSDRGIWEWRESRSAQHPHFLLEKALADLDKAVELKPILVKEVCVIRGYVLENLGRKTEAMEYYRKMLREFSPEYKDDRESIKIIKLCIKSLGGTLE